MCWESALAPTGERNAAKNQKSLLKFLSCSCIIKANIFARARSMAGQEFKFCPKCSAHLAEKYIEGQHRQACTACDFVLYRAPKPVAGVLAFQGEKLLLIRRGNEPRSGLWSFPTGYVDIGDTPEATAIREAHEEANVQVKLERLLGVYPNAARTVVLIVYVGTVVSGVPRGGAEALDARLFSPEALPQLAFEHDYQILNDLFGDGNEGSELNRAQQI